MALSNRRRERIPFPVIEDLAAETVLMAGIVRMAETVRAGALAVAVVVPSTEDPVAEDSGTINLLMIS
jgi:hypothetical protein